MSLNYEIRVRGRVGDQLVDALGLEAEVAPVETVLRGLVLDQAGLCRLLDRLQELALELVEMRRLPLDSAPSVAAETGAAASHHPERTMCAPATRPNVQP
jgi:hypothetical protein